MRRVQAYEFQHAQPPPARRDSARDALLQERLASHPRASPQPPSGSASGAQIMACMQSLALPTIRTTAHVDTRPLHVALTPYPSACSESVVHEVREAITLLPAVVVMHPPEVQARSG